MELLSGTDLRGLLEHTGKLDVEHALGFVLPIASALAHAHDLGVIHRDLKPANIVLARDVRDDVVPKLVDFGLSKAAGIVDASPTLTDMVAGTILYMAPEQTLGVKFATAASDQYSLGAIVYEAITGRPPFFADSLAALIEQIRNASALPPSAIVRTIPSAVDAAVLRTLAREPAARFGSVRELGRALLPFASAATVTAFERDFAERGSGKVPTTRPSARSSGRVAVSRASEVTRVETPVSPASRVDRTVSRVETPVSRVDATRADTPAPPTLPSRETDHPPPLPCAPGASPFHIKGNPYRGLVRFAKELPRGVDALCDALDDPRLRDFVRQPFLAAVRYDLLPLYPITYALARAALPFRTNASNDSPAAQARYDARTAYKRIFENAWVTEIPVRIARFNANYYDFGEYVGESLGEHRFAIEYRATPAYISPWFTRMNAAYTEETARICGARKVSAMFTTPTSAGTKGGFELVTFRVEVGWS
jgi:hypothetical protein